MRFYERMLSLPRPYIIAEIGANHYDIAQKLGVSPLDAARQLIDEAAQGGADAVKFQSYKADRLASVHSPAFWDLSKDPCESQFEEFQLTDHFGEPEYRALAAHAGLRGVDFMSTAFDEQAAHYLRDLMPAYKIASADITNFPLLRQIAGYGKPVLLSVGASDVGEVHRALTCLQSQGAREIVLLHCVLCYPARFEDAHLQAIRYLTQAFPGIPIGYSDHTPADESMLVCTMAAHYGARVIEKHFTSDKTIKANDHFHAADREDIRRLRANLDLLNVIDGSLGLGPSPCEREARLYARRSIYAARDLAPGQVIGEADLAFKRPGTGVSPEHAHLMMGRALKYAIAKDEQIPWEAL